MTSIEDLARDYMGRRPEAAAHVLEELPSADSAELMKRTPARLVGPMVAAMLPDYAARCVVHFDATYLAAVLAHVPLHRGALLLRNLSTEMQTAVFAQTSRVQGTALRLLLSYAPSVVGAWMDSRAATLPAGIDAAEARERLRRSEGHISHRAFVLDRARRLRGAVALAALMRATDGLAITELLEKAATLRARSSLADALSHRDWASHIDMPVINRHGEFVGVIDYDVLREAAALARGRRLQHGNAAAAGPNLPEIFLAATLGAWDAWLELMTPLESIDEPTISTEPEHEATRAHGA